MIAMAGRSASQLNHPTIDAREVGRYRLQGLDRAGQSLAMLGLDVAVGPPGQEVPQGDADHEGSDDQEREHSGDARHHGRAAAPARQARQPRQTFAVLAQAGAKGSRQPFPEGRHVVFPKRSAGALA